MKLMPNIYELRLKRYPLLKDRELEKRLLASTHSEVTAEIEYFFGKGNLQSARDNFNRAIAVAQESDHQNRDTNMDVSLSLLENTFTQHKKRRKRKRRRRRHLNLLTNRILPLPAIRRNLRRNMDANNTGLSFLVLCVKQTLLGTLNWENSAWQGMVFVSCIV